MSIHSTVCKLLMWPDPAGPDSSGSADHFKFHIFPWNDMKFGQNIWVSAWLCVDRMKLGKAQMLICTRKNSFVLRKYDNVNF